MEKFLLFFVLGFLSLTNAIEGGQEIEWDDAPYVVKIFARQAMNKAEKAPPVKSCTGALISPSLVLTDVECIKNSTNRQDLEEIMITYHIYGSNRQVKVLAETVEETDNWVLLKISPIDMKNVCPSEIDREKMITRLNIKPSLTKDMKIQLSFNTVKNLRCRDFINKRDLYKMEMMSFDQDPKNMNRLAYTIDSNSTACIEDLGTALVCHYEGMNLQVGFLRSLQAYPSTLQAAMEIEDPQIRSLAICAATAKMLFVQIYNDDKLIEAIEKYDLGGFVNAYSACGFNQ
ncbi:hypothetical protein FO519_003087 [Halicephalobus sp. NKZ332]|nr:hypothetical protein FO519_003087 [Halicephalobus sp. NKZ332]